MTAATGSSLRREEILPWRDSGAEIVVGDLAGTRVIGWSVNLQSSFGVTNVLRWAIGRSVARLAGQG
jgi:hypothetical protein